MQLTVAICTYNRIEPLRQALASMCNCDPIDLPWELLVIDNLGEPDVEQVVMSFQDRLPVRYVIENRAANASVARNRVMHEARAPIVLFTDDDVTFDSAWLKNMADAIRRHDECTFWGGRVEPVFTSPAPRWFDPKRCPMMGDMIVQYDGGPQSRLWDPDRDPPFYTANAAMGVKAVRRLGGFDERFGHKGAKRMGGEDSELIRRVHHAGGLGWYVCDALVYHPVPPQRLTRRFARQFAWQQGWTSVRMTLLELMMANESDYRTRPPRVPRWYYRIAITQTAGGMIQWLAGLASFSSARVMAGQVRTLFNLSKLWYAFRGWRSVNP